MEAIIRQGDDSPIGEEGGASDRNQPVQNCQTTGF